MSKVETSNMMLWSASDLWESFHEGTTSGKEVYKMQKTSIKSTKTTKMYTIMHKRTATFCGSLGIIHPDNYCLDLNLKTKFVFFLEHVRTFSLGKFSGGKKCRDNVWKIVPFTVIFYIELFSMTLLVPEMKFSSFP